MISGVTEHIGLDNMQHSCSLEVADNRQPCNPPTAQKTPRSRQGHYIQHRILVEAGDSLAVADYCSQVVSMILGGAKAEYSIHQQ